MALLWWRKKKDERAEAQVPEAGPVLPEAPAQLEQAPVAAGQVPEAVAPVVEKLPPPPPPEERSSWFARLTTGLTRTRGGFTDQLRGLFGGVKKFDESIFDDLEAILLGADVGPRTTSELVELLRRRVAEDPALAAATAMDLIRQAIREKLERRSGPMNLSALPSVVLVVGVNGVGKTTTIAKLARLFQAYNKRIMLVAGDTFRAGAIEQLTIWSQRLGCDLMKGQAGGDPSAVVFDAVNAARARKLDLVIVDTAGRLHTQSNLMEELGKINRVVKKVVPEAPHETFLVLDATTGQNAIAQAQTFDQMVKLSGLVVTKLDGTAKGGVVVALTDYLDIPIRFLGVGEGIDDLDNFRAGEFVEALFR
ncbi:MAG: signal recognition particle-docking protein FtsY [Candidatus Riflebacteria bacterium]|nr:signal recognition particle-docking protein FtsY [Candidatus Riflebacteria bacterium]